MTNDEQSYQNTTHKVNLTGGEISTILYHLEECNSTPELERIFVELQSVTDNYYAQLEEQDNNIMVLNYTSIHNKHWKDFNVQNNKAGH